VPQPVALEVALLRCLRQVEQGEALMEELAGDVGMEYTDM
jgi:hypothetical protein